ncbi:MAG: NADP-dependent malic enzyme [Candidatus ainarchaeum sp.]|nr:NADP-dependent malic enzyme [Candidatus ainarchaeum sp.]
MDAVEFHKKLRGKMEIRSRVKLDSKEALSLAYTPGVARVCSEIARKPELVYEYTNKWNNVAIVNDGTRILGLGDIGPEAGLPVMEGKAILFKEFGGVDAFPISLGTKRKEEIIAITKAIEPSFGGINLEDIETPKIFEIYEELRKAMNIPVFHDDRHGTGVVVLAGLINALKVAKKNKDAEIVLVGAGAAIMGIVELLLAYGISNITVLDSRGVLDGKRKDIESYKKFFVENSKPRSGGGLAECLKGADVVVAASAPGIIKKDMVAGMDRNAIVFALSNPNSEVEYNEAKKAGALVVATGRSDFPNQVNNVLAFPGIFRGALDVRAKEINLEMMVAAAEAIAASVKNPGVECIVPPAFDREVMKNVALAVARKAVETGVAQEEFSAEKINRRIPE